MSSSPPTNGIAEPTPIPVEDVKDESHVSEVRNDETINPNEIAAPESSVLSEAKRRLNNKCTPDEELRESLEALIALCQSLTTKVETLEPQIVDLQTTLTLTQSNLTLSLANTEMLEDALRTNAQSRDVGWRRSDSNARRPPAGSVSFPIMGNGAAEDQAKIIVRAPSPAGSTTGTITPTSNESRFFKFRFGAKTPSPTSPAYPQPQAAHLTSASLPSLGLTVEETKAKRDEELVAKQESLKLKASEVEARHTELVELEKKLKARADEVERVLKERESELEKISKELESERKAGDELKKEKDRVQEEIESLTQSLFEEANKMVADERRRAAEVEALLRETEEERDAVRGAMRVVEGENGRLRELSAGSRASEESARPRISEEAVAATQPESSHSSHEGEPTLQKDLAETNASKDSLSAPVKASSIPESSPDPWKAQAKTLSPPQTPPRVHALPTETSPWAEGRA